MKNTRGLESFRYTDRANKQSFFMFLRRLLQLVALVMIGDGVVGFFKPRWHSLLWDVGPAPYRDLMARFAEQPSTARLMYAGEVAVGILVATQQTPEKD